MASGNRFGSAGSGGGGARNRRPAAPKPGTEEATAKDICLRLLTGRARSRAELAGKLREREIPADVAERVLDRLSDLGLLDDAAYADAFVTSRHRDRGLGRSALRMELERKGIDRAVAEQAASAIDDDAERARAAELVAKKLDSAMLAGPAGARRRLIAMLARRGYSSSVAGSVVNDAMRGYAEPLDSTDEFDFNA